MPTSRQGIRRLHGIMAMFLCMVLAPALSASAAAVLSVSDDSFDFGASLADVELKHVFSIKNAGNTTLELKNVVTSCGCTVAELVNKSLEPGQTTELRVTLSTKGLSGKVSRQILIESNAAGSPQKILTLEAEVKASPVVAEKPSPVIVEPPVITVPPADTGRPRTESATLKVVLPSTIEILSVTSPSSKVKASITPETERGVYRVQVELSPEVIGDAIETKLQVKTSDPSINLEIPVIARALSRITVVPEKVVLFDRVGASPVTRFVNISPGIVKVFEIVSVESPLENANVTTIKLSDNHYRIELRGMPQRKSLNGTSIRVKFKSDDGVSQEVVVPIEVAAS